MASRLRRGFTLIELLVVIAIIALLISILLPALSKARNAGRLAISLSNCRQILIGASTYRSDQKDLIPMRGDHYLIDSSHTSVMDSWCTWSYGGKDCNAITNYW